MIGAIIGDIAGSVYEFHNTKTEDFPLITKESTFTDDTICTIAIADSAMNGWNYRDALLDWCLEYPHPMGGYGASFAAWLNSREQGREAISRPVSAHQAPRAMSRTL